jgi:hypothetical protein
MAAYAQVSNDVNEFQRSEFIDPNNNPYTTVNPISDTLKISQSSAVTTFSANATENDYLDDFLFSEFINPDTNPGTAVCPISGDPVPNQIPEFTNVAADTYAQDYLGGILMNDSIGLNINPQTAVTLTGSSMEITQQNTTMAAVGSEAIETDFLDNLLLEETPGPIALAQIAGNSISSSAVSNTNPDLHIMAPP